MGARRSWITLPLPLLMLSLSAATAQESSSARMQSDETGRALLEARTAEDRHRSDPVGVEDEFETRIVGGLFLNKSGLEIRQPLEMGERRVELGMKGPLMKRKRFGLAFELRF